MILDLPIRPIPQPRHRATRGGRMYLPSSSPVRAFKAAIQAAAKAKLRRPFDGPVVVTITAEFARPASHLTKGGRPRAGAPGWPGRNLGDLDNVAKAALDALIGIAFADDAQVVQLDSLKAWAHADRTVIRIEPLGSPCDAGSR